MPKGDAQAEALLPFQAEFAAIHGNFERAIESCLGKVVGIQQTDSALFDSKFLQAAAGEFDHDRQLLSRANGDAKLRIFQFGESFREKIDAHAEAILFKAVAQLA